MGCNALLQGIFPTKGSNQHLLQVPHESEDAHSCPTLCNPMEPARLPCPWDFPGKNTGVGCHFLLQEIFPTQGLNPGLLHCRQRLYHLSHQGRAQCVWILTLTRTNRCKSPVSVWVSCEKALDSRIIWILEFQIISCEPVINCVMYYNINRYNTFCK